MTSDEQIPEKDPRGELSDEAWAIYLDLAAKYNAFIDSEKAREARDREFEKFEKEGGPDNLAQMAVWLLNTTSDFAVYHALRAVAAYLAERPES
jgi:hypothetical protein